MSMLLRAPRECGSWWWELDDVAKPALDSALAVAARMVEVLTRHQLLEAHKLKYDWYVPGVGGVGIRTTLALVVPLDDPGLADHIAQSRPSGYPTAEVSGINIVGSGVWVDHEGRERHESQLVDLKVSYDPLAVAAELTVHHDIWKYYDFSGIPHPEVQRRNAPRLAAALQELESVLGVTAVPGEPTYFGSADGYGIETPEPGEDGAGPDLTDKF